MDMQENKAVVKKLVAFTTVDQFEEAWELIRKSKLQLSPSQAIRVLVGSCKVLLPEIFSARHFVDVLLYAAKYIEEPSDTEITTYYQALYHIITSLFKQKNYGEFFRILPMIDPPFMQIIAVEHVELYKAISIIIYNETVLAARAKDKANASSIVEMCRIVSTMHHKVRCVEHLLDYACKSIRILIGLEVDDECVDRYYHEVLDMAEGSVLDCGAEEKLFRAFVERLMFVQNYLLLHNRFARVSKCVQRTVSVGQKLFGVRYGSLCKILEICEWLNPVFENDRTKAIESGHRSLKGACKIHGRTDFEPILVLIRSQICFYVNYYTTTPKTWVATFSPEGQLGIQKFLSDLALLWSVIPSDHRDKPNLIEVCKPLRCALAFGRMYVLSQKGGGVSEEYKTLLLHTFDQLFVFVDKIRTEGGSGDGEEWKINWRDGVAHFSQIANHLYKTKDPDGLTFCRKFVKHTIRMEGPHVTGVNHSALCYGLFAISDMYYARKEYERSMAMSAFRASLQKDDEADLRSTWLKVKMKGGEVVQEATVVSVLKKHEAEIKEYWPGFQLDRKTCVKLLVMELQAYKQSWRSRVPMMATFRELRRVASPSEAAHAFASIWEDGSLPIHDSIPELLQKTIDKFQVVVKASNVDDNICMAQLLFLLHKYQIVQTVSKNSKAIDEELNASRMAASSKPRQDGDDLEDSDSEEIAFFDRLQFKRYLKKLKNLDRALDILSSLMDADARSVARENVYALFAQIGHEYRLHSNSARCLQAWTHASTIAKILRNDSLILEAVSSVLDLTTVLDQPTRSMAACADAIVYEMEPEAMGDGPIERVTLNYQISKALAYLYEDLDAALDAFRRAEAIMRNSGPVGGSTKLRFRLLRHRIVTLQCKVHDEILAKQLPLYIMRAFSQLYADYENTKENNSYYMSVFFDVCEEMFAFLHQMRMPRELSYFGKNIVVLSQRLMLPLRTASLLFYLAQADLETLHMDRCQIKVAGINEILCLSNSSKEATRSRSPQINMPKIRLDRAVESITRDLGGTMLDLPKRRELQTDQGSPILMAVETMRFPSFLDHPSECTCYYCISIPYKVLVMQKYFLDALVNVHREDTALAREFLTGCLELHDLYVRHCKASLQRGAIRSFLRALLPTYSQVLFEYGESLQRSNRLQEAQDTNSRLIRYLQPRRTENMYRLHQAISQRMDILRKKETNEEVKVPIDRGLSEEEGDTAVESSYPRTPESKLSRVTVAVETRPPDLSPPKRKIKGIKFNLYEDKEDEELPAPPKSERKPAKNRLPLPPAFSCHFAKTPARKVTADKSTSTPQVEPRRSRRNANK